jgi:hypothetical protein
MTEKDWSLDETINQIKHLLLEKDAEIVRLREALSDLVAVQNGPPLIQYEREWNEAMSKALAALKDGE